MPRPTPPAPLLLVLGATALIGCTEPEGEQVAEAPVQPPVAVVSDSAGITFRTSPAASLERVAYTVADTPDLLIDGTEGGGQPLHAVGGLAFGPQGTIAIAERGEMGIRIHDAEGERVRVVGRDGQGPGEFGALNGVGFRGDTMFVFDSRWFRISVFDGEGEFVRQFVPEDGWGPRPRWFAFAPEAGILTTSRGTQGDLIWGLHGFDGSPLQSFPSAPSPPLPTMTMLGPSDHLAGPVEPLRLFAATPGAGPWNDGVAAFSGEEYRLQIFDSSGELSEVWTVADAAPPRVTEADIRAQRDRVFAAADPAVHPRMERSWSNLDPAERFPAFGLGASLIFTAPPHVIQSQTGELWVLGYSVNRDLGPKWWVFATDGTLKGAVTFPPRFELQGISGAGALGITRDDYDVERVTLLRLIPPG